MIYHGDCTIDCGEHGHHHVELLRMIPAGSKLYTAPQPTPTPQADGQPAPVPRWDEMIRQQFPDMPPKGWSDTLIRRYMARELDAYRAARAALVSQQPAPSVAAAFQQRVQPWLLECFGAEIAADRVERNHRFLEESLELVQSLGCTASEAHQLVDYVFGRPVGDPSQEVGGVMVTLAALCLASGLDMRDAGEVELARISVPEIVTKIRAKQAAKPKHSSLPQSPTPQADSQPVPANTRQIAECYGDCPTDPKTCANQCKFEGRAPHAPADSRPAPVQDVERKAFKAAHRHLELDEVPDAWGRPMFKYSHVEASWLGWIARAARAPADSEVAHLRAALVYTACALHATPQYMLAEGITLIDGDTVRVSRDGWTVEASVNPARATPPAQAADSVLEDAARLDWLDKNIFHRDMYEWDARYGHGDGYNMWVLFAPKGAQGSARSIIDAARAAQEGKSHG